MVMLAIFEAMAFLGVATSPPEIDIIRALVNIIIGTPILLIVLLVSYFCGHIWSNALLRKKLDEKNFEKIHKYLYNMYGKTAIGMTWLSIVMTLVYVAVFQSLIFTIEYMAIIALTTLVVALALQGVLCILIPALIGLIRK